MSSPGSSISNLSSSSSSSSSSTKWSLRELWQHAKKKNDQYIHEVTKENPKYVSDEERSKALKMKLVVKSFPGNFGPTLDQLTAAYRKGDQTQTKLLAQRALSISQARLKVLAQAEESSPLGVYLAEINQKLMLLVENGLKAEIEADREKD
jgi:hypothetical protein